MEPKAAKKAKIDESLYSRQLYVYGHDAQHRMQEANILLLGLGGLGVELAKNIILAGVKSVGLLDRTVVEKRHRGSQFYLSKENVGQKRDVACRVQLADLNGYVDVHVVKSSAKDAIDSKRYNVVVATEMTLKQQVDVNNLCRKVGAKFISADLRGLLGSIFVDLGPRHIVSDIDGERPKRSLIKEITAAEEAVVTVAESNRHGLSTGDFVRFEEIKDFPSLNSLEAKPIKYMGPFKFSVKVDTRHMRSGSKSTSGGYVQQVKQPKEFKFLPLEKCVKNPKIASDMGDGKTLHSLSYALSEYKEKSGKYPDPTSPKEVQEVVSIAEKFANEVLKEVKLDSKKIWKLARTAKAVIGPLAAVVGGIAGQEVLKAASGKFSPISQFLYYSAEKCIPDSPPTSFKDYEPQGSRYDDYISIFGSKVQAAVQNLNIFLVGAGAIGCEMLKNFSMMGLGSAKDGKVTVTDMDTIEKSNLNRQFLFRPRDVGSAKSETAAKAAKAINSSFNVIAHTHRVGSETENIYNPEFWSKLDAVVTALDNVQARLYLDNQCIFYYKPMFDSGTLGTKGNTQVVLPSLTESYGSSQDPPEDSIPLCTLHNFPYKIEHTIQWARDKFEGLFKNVPETVNSYLTEEKYLEKLAEDPNEEIKSLELLNLSLGKDKPLSFEDCIHWARRVFEVEFNNKILQLITALPPDKVDADGNPFWTGHKRPPKPIKFDANNPLHIEFILATANLRAKVYGLAGSRQKAVTEKEALKAVVPEFTPSKAVKVAKDDEEMKKMMEEETTGIEKKLKSLRDSLPKPSSLTGYKLTVEHFEKDDPTNFHVDFVTACSNLRASNYEIKTASKHKTKQIAGKIIPAIATTTALVSGLVCLEIYKRVQDFKLEAFSNSYANLAISHITASEPFQPAYKEIEIKKGKKMKFSLWDKVEVKIGATATLKEFCEHFEEKLGLQICMLSYGQALLYSQFGFMAKKKNKLRFKMTMPELIETVGKLTLPKGLPFVMFEAMVTTEDDEDVDIPSIRFWLKTDS